MKQTVLILTLILSFSCSSQVKDIEIETFLYDCLVKSYKEKQIDINQELDELENYLIGSASLKSPAGQSYFDFYKQIAELNDITLTLDQDRFENIFKLTPNEFYSIECLEKLESLTSSTIADSKFSQMTLAMKNAAQNEVSPSSVAKAILSVLGPSDFDKKYYRAAALLSIAYTANLEIAFQGELKQNNIEDISEFESLLMTLTEKDQIILNENEISKEKLKTVLSDFIRANPSNHIIILRTHKDTTYDFYLNIKDQIELTYNELSNELAMTRYNQIFKELTEDQQDEIKRTYTKRIQIYVGQHRM